MGETCPALHLLSKEGLEGRYVPLGVMGRKNPLENILLHWGIRYISPVSEHSDSPTAERVSEFGQQQPELQCDSVSSHHQWFKREVLLARSTG